MFNKLSFQIICGLIYVMVRIVFFPLDVVYYFKMKTLKEKIRENYRTENV